MCEEVRKVSKQVLRLQDSKADHSDSIEEVRREVRQCSLGMALSLCLMNSRSRMQEKSSLKQVGLVLVLEL